MPRSKDQADICNVPPLMRGTPEIWVLVVKKKQKVRVHSKAYKVSPVNYTLGMEIEMAVHGHPYKHMAVSFG